MRIAFFSDNAYPELSGIVDSIHSTGKELARRGHTVVYVGPHYSKKEYRMVERSRVAENGQETVDGMPIIRLTSLPLPFSPTGQSRFAFPFGDSYSYLDKFNPDIVHTHSPYGTGLEAMWAARRYHAPLVGTNHTAVEEFYPFAPNIMRRYDAWYYNHCTFMTAPYGDLIAQMRAKGFRQPAAVLSNPVELSLFHPPHSEEKNEIKIKMGLMGPVVLYCGRLAPEKHIDVIVKAVARIIPEFPNLAFVVTGRGSSLSKLQTLAQELNIEKNVHFAGFIPMEKLPDYYKAADIFSIMSTADSQSIALMQAYATGVPAVGARSRGLPDYIRQDTGFLVEPDDDKTLAAKITELLTDEALHRSMGKAGLQFVQKLSPQNIADEWEKIYIDALSRG